MVNIKHLLIIIVALAAISSPSSNDWYGFRGLEKEGRGDLPTGPLNWSSSQNVVWKTVIPGRGHSSPIVSGDAVYLTTAYQVSRLSPLQKIWKYTIFLLTLLFTMMAIAVAIPSLGAKQKIARVWQYVRFFVFAMFLGGVTIVIFFGFYLLNLDDDAVRAWLTSIMIALSCLLLSLFFVPLRSRQHLVASSLSLMFTVPAFIALKHKGLVSAFGSFKGVIIIVALLSPLVVGLALLAGYFLSRKRQSKMIRNRDDARPNRLIMWHFVVTGIMGLVVALAPFFLLLYRAADYRMPDSVVWHNRIRPDINWLCIGLYVMLVILTIVGCFWKSVRGGLSKRLPLQGIFFVIALALGVAFFIDVNFVERREESVCAIICLNRESGEVLWTCEGLRGHEAGGESRVVTHASATPVTDGKRIYGYFGKDGLMCVSPEGKLVWKKTEPMFHSKFGVGTSPVVKDNILIVVSDERESDKSPSSITAFDCLSGKRLWEKERKSHKVDAAYNTPLIKSLNGREVVIVHGWYDIKGYDLKTGQELWSYSITHEGKHLVASLVSDIEHLYVIGAKQISALDLSKLGTADNPFLWSRPIPGEKSSTPVVINGLLFLVTETGPAFCLDAKTGEVLWKKRLEGRYFSSVVAMGNKVFFTNESGRTTVVTIDREFRQLAKNTLDESVYATFVPVGSQLFARTSRYLYCIQEDKQ